MAFVDKRPQLHQILSEVLGSKNVYFQPPESLKLSYPCVVYSRNYANTLRADNVAYAFTYRYQIIYIDKNPDSDFTTRLIQRLPMCEFDTHYTADNLNHEVLNLYF